MSILLIEKRIAINIPHPKIPFSRMLTIIERGTMTAAFLISSDIWKRKSTTIVGKPKRVMTYVDRTVRSFRSKVSL